MESAAKSDSIRPAALPRQKEDAPPMYSTEGTAPRRAAEETPPALRRRATKKKKTKEDTFDRCPLLSW